MYSLKKICYIAKISALLIPFIIPFYLTMVFPADVILIWDRSYDSRVAGYKIFYGSSETDFKAAPKEIIHNATQTSCDIFNLTEGKTYGFTAKSMDDKGNESVFSEVIFYNVPNMPDNSPNNGKDGNSEDENEKQDDGGGGGCFILITQTSSMKTADGRKLSPPVMEEIRKRAVERVHAGESPEKVIKALGFARAGIYDWLAQVSGMPLTPAKGPEGPKSSPAPRSDGFKIW